MAQQQAQKRHGTPAATAPTGAGDRHGVDPRTAVFLAALAVVGARYARTASLADRPAPGGAR